VTTDLELDTLFGYKFIILGGDDDVERRYKMRVMLTRKQAKVVRRAQAISYEIVQFAQRTTTRMQQDLADATEEAILEETGRITDETEALEEKCADAYFAALRAMIIDLPDEFNELSMSALAAIYRQVVEKQAEDLKTYVKVETDHPTNASSG
jgi:hypothetical protein